MKYKVNDRVRIKSLDWYNENKDEYGNINCGSRAFFTKMSDWCGEILTINRVVEEFEYYCVSECIFSWTDEMIEGLYEEIEREHEDKIFSEGYDQGYEDGQHDMNEWVLPEGYLFTDENGNVINATKIVLEKKKKEYPKTYEEYCRELNIVVRDFDILYNMLDTTEIIYTNNLDRLLNSFRKLLICRDAYWKIAGEEMGLGKPWEPDFVRGKNNYTITREGNEWCFTATVAVNCILAFPTREMRDEFYENFKELIESVKELL